MLGRCAAFALLLSTTTLFACGGDDAATPKSSESSTASGSANGPAGTGGAGGAGGTDAGGGSQGGGGQGGEGGRIPMGSHCFAGPLDVAPTANGFAVTTTHYELSAEATQPEAEEMARILEASYGAYLEYFGVEPQSGDLPLDVRFYADYDAWAAALTADGITPPATAGGYYDPNGGVGYLYDQPTRYFTHELLVHEAAHQYHHLARGGVIGQPAWYVEGLAEYLQRHDWDGSCVRLGIIPLLTQEDGPKSALDDVTANGLDLGGIVSGGVDTTRPIMWSIVHYLEHGDGGTWHDGFGEFKDAMDAGSAGDVIAAFTSAIAAPADLEAPLTAWLAGAQEPMSIVFLEWTHVGPSEVIGDSPFFSMATLKASVAELEAHFDVPAIDPWDAGVILEYDSVDDFTGLVVTSTGRLSTFEMVGGSATWFDQGGAPPANAGGYQITVAYPSVDTADVTINGVTSSYPTVFAQTSGLAVNGARVSFDGIAWQGP